VRAHGSVRQTPGATAPEVWLTTGHFGYAQAVGKTERFLSFTRDAKIEEAQQVMGLGQALPPELLAAKPKRLRFLIFNRAGRSCIMPLCGVPAALSGRGDSRLGSRPRGASLTPPCLRTATLTDGLSHTIFPASGASVLQIVLANNRVPPDPCAPHTLRTDYGQTHGGTREAHNPNQPGVIDRRTREASW
jgi:hypothetical protein